MLTHTTRDGLCLNAIRMLSMDGVEKAKARHPGTAMALAPVMYTLWDRFFPSNPAHQPWRNRDRFILSSSRARITAAT